MVFLFFKFCGEWYVFDNERFEVRKLDGSSLYDVFEWSQVVDRKRIEDYKRILAGK